MSFKPSVILGLDFDGVLHQEHCPDEEQFVHLERFQEAMREIPQAGIVITSNWRQTWSVERMRTLFAPDIAARIIDATPDLHPKGRDVCGIRQHELEGWMAANAPGLPWLALDDNPGHFESGYPHLLALTPGGIGLQPEHLMELVARLQRLASANQSSLSLSAHRNMENSMPVTRYVIIAAISPDGERIALLTKDKGPEQLIGKVTFPGGRIEADDADALFAAQRELLEETGLSAPLEAFKVVHVETDDTRELHVVFVSCDVGAARTMESERVHVAALRSLPLPAEVRERIAYAPDFFERLGRVMPDIELLRAAHAASGGQPPVAAIPCDLPNFRQSLDRERPHKLLDTTPHGQPTKLEPNRRHQLVYQYTDTGDTVVVPNVWYNQTPAMRASHTRWLAEQREERVAAMRAKTPDGWTVWMVENVAARMLANAAKLREHADKVEKGELSIHDQFSLADEAAPSVGSAREQEARDRAAGTWPPASLPAAPATRRMRM